MTQEEYLKHMRSWADGERMVPEAAVGGLDNVVSHFTHWYRIAELLNEGDRVVEIGCGCGLPARIYSLKTQAPVVAVDKADVVALSRVFYPTPGVSFVVADFNNDLWLVPVKERGPFDVVVCVDVIEHVHNKGLFLSCLQALGGTETRYIVTTPIGDDDIPWHIHHWGTLKDFLDDVCRFLPRERTIRV